MSVSPNSEKSLTPKRKLLIVGATYLSVENRKKTRALHEHFDVTLVIPKVKYLKTFKVEASLQNVPEEKFKILALPFLGSPEEGNQYLLRGLRNAIRSATFEVILVEAEPWSWIRWQTWFLKRLFSTGALFGEITPQSIASTGFGGKIRLIFFQLATQTTDFVITQNNEIKVFFQKSGLWEKKIFTESNISEFIAERIKLEKKSVLWIDSLLSHFSPSTKQLCESLSFLKKNYWEIRYLGYNTGLSSDEIESNIVYFPKKIHFLAPYFATLLFSSKIMFSRILKGKNLASIIHSTHGNYFFADISSVHFWGPAYFKKIFIIKMTLIKKTALLLSAFVGSAQDFLHLKINPAALYLFVSREIKSVSLKNPTTSFKIFPNSYDQKRFCPDMKLKWRETARKELGFNSNHLVFLFSSQGHYERKGLWRAFESLFILHQKYPQIRFLVVGGYEKRIEKLKQELSKKDPHYNSWIYFAGMQNQIEKYYSAADAFLFPSYFEAFCLAEIECAALGIPLLLTQHPGVEMILRHGKNGLLLPEKPKEIAKIIETDFIKRSTPWTYDIGEAVTQEQYSQNLSALYEEVWKNKFNP